MSESAINEKQSYLTQSTKKRKDAGELEESTTADEDSSVRDADLEEATPLLQTRCHEDVPLWAGQLYKTVHEALDVFKGILVVIMTLDHILLGLMSPDQQYAGIPHVVGNMAASVCFLGFMLAYGFSSDYAYFSDMKARSSVERLRRVLRSAALPVVGAWVCAFGWGWMFYKLPMDFWTLIYLLDFRITLGNGPDFLLCFTVALLVTYPLRQILNIAFKRERPLLLRISFAIIMLLVPLKLTQIVIEDCTGVLKYYGYFLECTKRDAYAPALAALPHLFYFNMGIILSRIVHVFDGALKAGCKPDKGMLIVSSLLYASGTLILSYPLLTLWSSNFGNIMGKTSWGMVTRGFTDGPSVLWLLGNIAPVSLMFTTSIALHCVATFHTASSAAAHWMLLCPLRRLRDEMAHLGSNVLMYFVVADLCIAGLYRGPAEQTLSLSGCISLTLGILAIARFLGYLSATGRSWS